MGGIPPEKASRIMRFFDRVHQFFTNKPQVDLKLEGRIIELRHATDKVLLKFQKLKKKNGENLHDQLIGLLNEVIDPMIKEITRLRESLMQKESPEVQVKNVHRCTALLERAKVWIELSIETPQHPSNYYSKISTALVNYHIMEMQSCIDRDIRLIWNYLDNALFDLPKSPEEKVQMKEILSSEIVKAIAKLEDLKIVSKELTVEELAAWRIKINYMRSKYFANILHMIDERIRSSS